ncbi:hypothetical protein C1645_828565 [Glomus cerebriforme]|uniref:Uncharacterized protein n=1 Tax=Glomus cerebriforme TaxID=658196 RepID=A0A397SLL1_9GLOM|nr:hypothetical protein C1645_828565 [Glomus cerebriforme]
MPLILSLQRFQISQSFTYEGQLTPLHLFQDLDSQSENTINDNFIEDIMDEPQITLMALLDGMDISTINIALETGSDNELVKLLKDFISIKQRNHDNNNTESTEHHQNNDDIVPLQQILIDKITDSHVTKVRGASRKKE